MANEISHPRELAVLVVRRVGVVSVIVPAGPAKQEERKEGRSVLFHSERRLGGKAAVVKRENKTVTERWLFPSPPLYEFSAERRVQWGQRRVPDGSTRKGVGIVLQPLSAIAA